MNRCPLLRLCFCARLLAATVADWLRERVLPAGVFILRPVRGLFERFDFRLGGMWKKSNRYAYIIMIRNLFGLIPAYLLHVICHWEQIIACP